MQHHLFLAATHDNNPLGLIIAALVVLAVLAFIAFFLVALASILRSPLSMGMKVVWVVLAFCAPFLGPLLWFVIGRNDARRTAGVVRS